MSKNTSDTELATRDAEMLGVGYLVNGKRVHPENVVVIYGNVVIRDQVKQHIKEEFVKVDDSIFDLKEEFEAGELYYLPNEPGNYQVIETMDVLCHCAAYSSPKIYRKVVTKLTERGLFLLSPCSTQANSNL